MSVLAGAFVVSLLAQVAAGEPSWDARVERAVALRLGGKEEEALALFKAAEKERTSPRFLAQMALTEQALGYWVDAETHLAAALEQGGDPWIVKNRPALTNAMATVRDHLGTLELRGESRGDVRLDGRSIGTLPLPAPLRLEIGRHRIDVEQVGTYPFQRDIVIRANETSRETVVLVATPIPAPEPAVLAKDGPDVGSRTAGLVLVSVSAVATIAGVTTLVVGNGRASSYNDNAACLGQATDPSICREDASASRTYRTISIVSFVTAGATAVLGGVFLLRARSTSPRVHAQFDPTGAMLTFQETF